MKKSILTLLSVFAVLCAVLGVFLVMSIGEKEKYRLAVYERAYTQACEASEGLSRSLLSANKNFLPSDVSDVGAYASVLSMKLSELSLDPERGAALLRYLALISEISENSLRLLDIGEKNEYYQNLFGSFAAYAKRVEEDFLPVLGEGEEYGILDDIFLGLENIYHDGLYSDEEREGLFSLLKNSPILDIDEVMETAERFFGKNAKLETGFVQSFPPFYNFHCENVSLDISQMGGYVLRFLYDHRDSGNECTPDAAKEKMYRFLKELGFKEAVMVEFSDEGDYFGSFAPEVQSDAGKILCLSETIKICVGRSSGKVTSYDAELYYKYHKIKREVEPLTIPEGATLAYIIGSSGRETLCYEKNGEFFNAESGRRETKIY